ncbi:MAG: DPP IV N-terminal domain-containing protein [Prevotella sp.]|nr:DPP IV N-terminal domain-containing protein [Prevotella sp.]
MKKTKYLLIIAFVTLSLPMSAQKLFSLEDLNFGGNNYRNLQPENKWLTWWGDELVRTDVEECYLVDKKTGKETRLFTLDEVNKWANSDEEANRYVRHLMNATFPYPDLPLVALGNKQSFLLLDFKKHEIVWQDSISGQTANDWNKTSRATAYVEDYQLFVVDGEGKKHQLSIDGSRSVVYGSAVHRNEFGIHKGTFWSPDGQRLAFYRMDQSMVQDYPQVDIFPREATYEPDKYPMAGMNAHVVTVGVYDINTNKTVYLKTPVGSVCGDSVGTSTPIYFTNIAWSPDAKTIYMFELNRDQNDCRLVSYDTSTGERIAELYRETSDKYVEPMNPIQFLPWDNNKFIMQSQRDGYNHLYLYNKEGKLLSQLTSGSWVVQEVLGFNAKQKSIIIEANKYHPLHRQLYSVSVSNGKMTQLTIADGVHHGDLSSSGNYVIDRHSAPTEPRNINVVTVSGGSAARKAVRLLTASDPWDGYEQPIFECGSIKAADGVTDLYYRMVKPHNFNPQKKYPTVVYVYGGPHAHNVEAGWHWYSRTWETYMAQKGYVLFILDNRGSEYRGRDFEQATFRQLGQIEMQDQMKGVEYLKSLPYVDMNRLGIHGWSFGGFMTISLMLNYPDVFKVGVAGGPVIDWKWYEVMYGERYMDTPQQNPEGYAKASLIDKACNLKGKLQIITGYNDNTVVPQHCLSFLDACIKAGTQPDFFAYPGEEHNMRGHASVHLHERITQYFEDYLK